MYLSFREAIAELSTEEKGCLLDVIFSYHSGEPIPELPKLVKIVFSIMKPQFERDSLKYQRIVERNRINGALGGRPRENPNNPNNPDGYFGNPNDNDNDTDSDNDNDNDSDAGGDALEKLQKEFYDSLIPFIDKYGKDQIRDFYNYYSEPDKSRTKIKYQMYDTWDTKTRLERWAKRSFNNQPQKPDPPAPKEEKKIMCIDGIIRTIGEYVIIEGKEKRVGRDGFFHGKY